MNRVQITKAKWIPKVTFENKVHYELRGIGFCLCWRFCAAILWKWEIRLEWE